NDNANVSTYIFSTNNTGTWTNGTAVVFSSFHNSTAAWANVTKTLNDTVGNVVSYMWYANDTSNNWSHSIQYNLTLSAIQRYLTVTSPYGTPGGEGWYDDGSAAYASLDTGTVDHGNGTRRVFDYWSGDASGTDYAQSDPILMDGSKTAVANWKTQHLLTLATDPDGVDSPSGAGWYDSAAYAPISTTDIVDITPDSSRYTFDGWTTGDISEIVDPSSPSTTVLMDKPKTVTANYKTQYYLTITHTSGGITDPAGSGWYDAGTTASVTAIPDLDYVLNYWALDGSPVSSNPCDVLMNSAHTLHAVFEYSPPEYYLTVSTDPLGVTSILGEGWHVEGSAVILAAPEIVDVSTGIRYSFSYWDVDGTPRGTGVNSITVHMDANHTATAHYTLQYYLAVTSPYDTPTPPSGWFDAGMPITDSVTSPWAGPAGTRYVCIGWTGTGSVPASGTEASVTFTLDEPSNITWNWKTQHLLNVLTDPEGISPQPSLDPLGEADPAGGWWFDESSSVALTAQPVDEYVFTHWTVDDASQGEGANPVDVTMDGAHTAVAYYVPIIHDVAVIDILTSKSGCTPMPTLGQGYSMKINVTVANQGDKPEVFNVTLYANTSVIGIQSIALDPAESATLTFVWDSAGWAMGNYTISAVADTVPGEEATDDNTLNDGFIFVTLPGDIDGDRDVDIFDIVRMAGVYGVKYPNPRYNPNCDLDNDGDIDIFDVVAAAGNYGKSW
ncbi:MAG: CARDB domain-containing protein, partial [Candidatus Bathyarchaeia archaeon]